MDESADIVVFTRSEGEGHREVFDYIDHAVKAVELAVSDEFTGVTVYCSREQYPFFGRFVNDARILITED